MVDLTSAETHFAFGENWKSFVAVVDETRVGRAVDGVRKLFPEGLAGARVLDVGCGSGLSALAMLRLGAARVDCVDIDPHSVDAARALLNDVPAGWTARVGSVFELEGRYDVVHSWGVLHHTGALWRAVDKAASLVEPGGRLAIAIYAKTPLCGLWKLEKRLYARSRTARRLIRPLFRLAYFAALRLKGQSPRAHVDGYRSRRGMDFEHDLHDWLGGFPYESATPGQVVRRLQDFDLVRRFGKPAPAFGLFGTGCHEYVFAKRG